MLSKGKDSRVMESSMSKDTSEMDLESKKDDVPLALNHGGNKSGDPRTVDDEETIVAWEENDPENPYNWSTVRLD